MPIKRARALRVKSAELKKQGAEVIQRSKLIMKQSEALHQELKRTLKVRSVQAGAN